VSEFAEAFNSHQALRPCPVAEAVEPIQDGDRPVIVLEKRDVNLRHPALL
jgi:hypothetical protein